MTKKWAITGLVLALVIFLWLYLEKQNQELQLIHEQTTVIQNQKAAMLEQLAHMTNRLDSVEEMNTLIQPIDLANISSELKQSVYKILVWYEKEQPTQETESFDAAQHQPEYEVKAGTAFCIFKENVVMTNYHVVGEHALYALLIDHNNQEIPITEFILSNENLDYTLLKAEGLAGMPLSPTLYKIKDGIQTVAMGNPLQLDFTPSVGWITSLRLSGYVLQISNPITYGNSGGPLVDSKGRLLGLVFGGFTNNAMLNFAVNIHAILDNIAEIAGIENWEDIPFQGNSTHISVFDVNGANQQFKPEMASLSVSDSTKISNLPLIIKGHRTAQ